MNMAGNLSRLMASALVLALHAGALHAQSSCSSDGQPRPVGLLERFINADCESCWSDAGAARPRAGDLALDWIVPGSRGDDAPLSAAANRDALSRLEALRRPVPPRATSTKARLRGTPGRLRVAQGLPFNGYIGVSIELNPANGGPWKAWLLLVETIPAGTEGTPIARNLVRNALQPAWDGSRPLSKKEQQRLFELRPMNIPEGTNLDRLSVVGWVEDPRGQIRAIAQSRCARPPSRG
jgi:hypothetical protein